MAARRDVIVAGAGPAGLALAMSLSMERARTRQLSIAVVAAVRPHRIRLGETLAPDAGPLLAQLGLDPFASGEHARCQGTIAVWGSDDAHYTDFLYHPSGHGWRLDRERFDAALGAEVRRRGVEWIEGDVGSVTRGRDQWAVTIGETIVSAPMLVDATGRQSIVARRLGAKRIVADALVGIAGVFKGTIAVSDERWSLIEARRDGWVYSAVLPDGRVAVVAMTDSDLANATHLYDAGSWRGWIEELPRTRARIAGATLTEGPFVASSASHRLDRPTGEGWLAVGDSAMAFDPLSSQGISKALRSGIRAAKAIRASLEGTGGAFDAYANAEDAEYAAYLAARQRYYAMETRWSDAPFWQRRIGPSR